MFLFVVPVSSLSAVERAGENLSSVVRSVTESGLIILYGETNFARLWGVDPDVEYLEDLIVQNSLSCRIEGEIHAQYMTVKILNCWMGSELELDGKTVTEHLITSGHGREICVETRNQFGTCEE